MGMCLALHSVSDINIAKIIESPPLIWRLIATDDPDIYLQTVKESTKGHFLSRPFRKKPNNIATVVPNLSFIEGENIADDLDKSWQGIHYCLNKTAYDADPPMDFITVGGEYAGHVEVGYGPARLIDSKTVKEIEQKISSITTEQLAKNYNPEKMKKLDIYPNIWEREGEEGFEYIAEYFEVLQSFITQCAKHKLGIAIYLC